MADNQDLKMAIVDRVQVFGKVVTYSSLSHNDIGEAISKALNALDEAGDCVCGLGAGICISFIFKLRCEPLI